MGIRNRLSEYLSKANLKRQSGKGEPEDRESIIITTDTKGAKSLDEFLKWVSDVQQLLHDLEKDVDKMQVLQKKTVTTFHSERTETFAQLEEVKSSIKEKMGQMGSLFKNTPPLNLSGLPDGGASHLQIRDMQLASVKQRFEEVSMKYHEIEATFLDDRRAMLKRICDITGNELSDEQRDEMLETENWSIFSSGLLLQTAEAKQQFEDADNRYKDLLKLEHSILELHTLFKDISSLIHAQGTVITSVEVQVEETKHTVCLGKEQLSAAERLKRAIRKKKFWLYSILITTVVVITAVVVVCILL